jgi:hypothetical protein
MADHLDLTPEQEAEPRTAIIESRGGAEPGGDEMRERLAAVLTQQQRAELDEMRPARGRGFRGGCRK